MFEFDMRYVQEDRTGYYYARWDRATPITLRAETREDAFKKLWALLPKTPPRGAMWTWTAKIDKIREVAA